MKKEMKSLLNCKAAEWIKNHSLISATVLFVIVVAIVFGIVFAIAGKNKAVDVNAGQSEESSEAKDSGSTDNLLDNPLECDAHPEVNEVMTAYHNALAENNQELIKQYLLYVNDNELENFAVKSEYVEGYNDIKCYTQRGFTEGSYYVYVSYQLKMKDYDTMIPGLVGLYYCPDEQGNYHIYRKIDMSEEVLENFYQAYMQEDVQELYNTVALKYTETLDGDENLKAFMGNFETLVKDEVVKRIAMKEASEALLASSSEPESVETQPQSQPDTQVPSADTVKATTTVNVRSSDSETADKLGKVTQGTTLSRLEEKVNGWSKVLYEGKEGYIKTEFLEVVAGTEGETTVGYVTAKENVNIRSSASETGDRIVLAYQGEKFELIEKMSNGWTKIKYDGKVAYVKSDYVE